MPTLNKNDKTITVTVDGESIDISRKNGTPRIILEAAGLDPSTRYLIEKRGNNTISYRDNPDEELNVHQSHAFLTGRCGPLTLN